MGVDDSWKKIERWIAERAPQEDPLPAPCSHLDLESLYERLGVRLPDDLERSLLRHNGSGLTEILPPGFTLLSVDDILENRADWMKYAAPDDASLGEGDKPFLVPFAKLSRILLLVDVRTGRLGEWENVQGFFWERDQLWGSFTSAMDFVGNLLASPPPWIAMLPGDDEWEVTERHPDFPGTLTWTEDPIE